MSSPTVLEETTVPLYVVKAALVANQEKGELTFRANKTLEYLNAVEIIDAKSGEAVAKELAGLEIPRMKDAIIHKLIDVQPKTLEELKGVLSAYTLTVSKENLDKLFEVLNKL